jgi:hypothetical protein
MSSFGGAWAGISLVLAGACVTLACGGGDEGGEAKPDCGTESDPDLLVLANVEPTVGAAVPNTGIVHRFKILGTIQPTTLTLGLPAAHTAGLPIPNPTMWQPTPESDGYLYTSSPMSWTTAPSHVQIEVGMLRDPEGCIYAFPSPLFSYEITAP